MFRFASRRLASQFCRCNNLAAMSCIPGIHKYILNPIIIYRAGYAVGSSSNTKFPEQTKTNTQAEMMPENEFLVVAKHTLDHISEQLEALADDPELKIPDEYDVSFNGDVLTLKLGNGRGTYVLNTQTPNRQIWLSSPKSGPKRFDWTPATGTWVYRHDGSELGQLLSVELTAIFKTDVIINPYIQNR